MALNSDGFSLVNGQYQICKPSIWYGRMPSPPQPPFCNRRCAKCRTSVDGNATKIFPKKMQRQQHVCSRIPLVSIFELEAQDGLLVCFRDTECHSEFSRESKYGCEHSRWYLSGTIVGPRSCSGCQLYDCRELWGLYWSHFHQQSFLVALLLLLLVMTENVMMIMHSPWLHQAELPYHCGTMPDLLVQ